jgi:hypothetical protein
MDNDNYIEYIEREFCKEYPCAIEKEMHKFEEGSDEYNRIRALCNGECLHTAKDFQKWLKARGYLIHRPGH